MHSFGVRFETNRASGEARAVVSLDGEALLAVTGPTRYEVAEQLRDVVRELLLLTQEVVTEEWRRLQ